MDADINTFLTSIYTNFEVGKKRGIKKQFEPISCKWIDLKNKRVSVYKRIDFAPCNNNF